MRRALLHFRSSISTLIHHQAAARTTLIPVGPPLVLRPISTPVSSTGFIHSNFRFFTSSTDDNNDENDSKDDSTTTQLTEPTEDAMQVEQDENERVPDVVESVSNKDFKEQISNYFKGDQVELPGIMESILRRSLAGDHGDTDDELIEELRMKPVGDVRDQDVEEDFVEAHDTDNEVDHLCDAKELVEKRMMNDEFFNMDERKWDAMVNDAMKHGALKDLRECEEILEDMQSWDKLLPDEIKIKVERKFHELGDMCERGELETEEAYELFKKFEDEMVVECQKILDSEGHSALDIVSDLKVKDDPPGEGPILKWELRAVFPAGGDSWHPKNRKVKLSTKVKDYRLSKHQFTRLKELVGKRYNRRKDELTITSERYEDREENRKDCLRTLIAVMDEARKASKLVEDARTVYMTDRLKQDPEFMKRLQAKVEKHQSSQVVA